MDREQVIQIARQAGFITGTRDYGDGSGGMRYVQSVATGTILVELEKFAALVEAGEREECAKVCERMILASNGGSRAADAIRTRGGNAG